MIRHVNQLNQRRINMSKHKIAKQISKLMTTNGFKIIRQTNHYVWQNAEGLIITTCKTPSDNYAYAQSKRQLRRLLSC